MKLYLYYKDGEQEDTRCVAHRRASSAPPLEEVEVEESAAFDVSDFCHVCHSAKMARIEANRQAW